ncbi:MAG: YgfZ/GcvT domain-containing protein [Burkholderiaceae bacterium]
MPEALRDGVCRLSHLGVIRAQGADAAKFLHGQLTNDFALLRPDQARLAALCSPKGRMLASFIGFKRASDDILLLCSTDLLPATLKRLSMFVLRAQCKLSDASAEWAVWGLSGEAVERAARASTAATASTTSTADGAPWSVLATDRGTLVRLYPADGVARALCVSDAAAAHAAPQGPAIAEDVWLWSEVRSGVARITQPVVEAFVPQMLNYESVGGVNFQKGCYPGQEVVARSQFRGTLKRRAYRVHIDGAENTDAAALLAACAPGTEIFHSSDAEQPVGELAQSAASPGSAASATLPRGGVDAIACLTVSAVSETSPASPADVGSLHVGSATGPVLRVESLPYPLRDDI